MNENHARIPVRPAIAPTAQEQENCPHDGMTRAAALEKALADEKVHSMGAEYKLYVRLLVIEKGSMLGSYEQIGHKVGGDYRTAKRYIQALEDGGWISVGTSGKQIQIQLTEPHLSTARMPDAPPTQPVIPAIESDKDLQRIHVLYETAMRNGQTLTVNLEPLTISAGSGD